MLASVDLEDRVPKNHPLQTVTYEDLGHLSPEFDRMYLKVGRASVQPGGTAEGIAAISLYSVCRSGRSAMNSNEPRARCVGVVRVLSGAILYTFTTTPALTMARPSLNRASIGCRQIPWGVWFAPGSYGFVLRTPFIGARQASKTVRDVIRIGSKHRDVPATHRVRRAVLRDHAARSEDTFLGRCGASASLPDSLASGLLSNKA